MAVADGHVLGDMFLCEVDEEDVVDMEEVREGMKLVPLPDDVCYMDTDDAIQEIVHDSETAFNDYMDYENPAKRTTGARESLKPIKGDYAHVKNPVEVDATDIVTVKAAKVAAAIPPDVLTGGIVAETGPRPDFSLWTAKDDILLKAAIEAGASMEALTKGAIKFSKQFTIKELRERWRALLYDPEISEQAALRMAETEGYNGSRLKNSRKQRYRTNSVRYHHYKRRKLMEAERLISQALEIGNTDKKQDDADINERHAIVENGGLFLIKDNVSGDTDCKRRDLMEAEMVSIQVRENGNTDKKQDDTQIGARDVIVENDGPCLIRENSNANVEDQTCLQMITAPATSGMDILESGVPVKVEGIPFENDIGFQVHPLNNNHKHSVDNEQCVILKGEERVVDLNTVGDSLTEECVSFYKDPGKNEGQSILTTCEVANVELELRRKGTGSSLSETQVTTASDKYHHVADTHMDLQTERIIKAEHHQVVDICADTTEPVHIDVPEAPNDDEVHVDHNENIDVLEGAGYRSGESCEDYFDYDSPDDQMYSETGGAFQCLSNTNAFIATEPMLCSLNTEDPDIPSLDDSLLPVIQSDLSSSSYDEDDAFASELMDSLADMQNESLDKESLDIDAGDVSGSFMTLLKSASPVSRQEGTKSVWQNASLSTPGDDHDEVHGNKFFYETAQDHCSMRDNYDMMAFGSSFLDPNNVCRQSSMTLDVQPLCQENYCSISRQANIDCASPQFQAQAPDGSAEFSDSPSPVCREAEVEEDGDQQVNQKYVDMESEDELARFSDVEATVLQMELNPLDDFPARAESKRTYTRHRSTIIRLEQGANAAMQRRLTAHGAAAVLYGRRLRYYITKNEVSIGRVTQENMVDIDLGKEGRANKVSRKQASIKLKEDGMFYLKNLGRRMLCVNNIVVGTGHHACLDSNCLIEVGGMRFIFDINKKVINERVQEMLRGG